MNLETTTNNSYGKSNFPETGSFTKIKKRGFNSAYHSVKSSVNKGVKFFFDKDVPPAYHVVDWAFNRATKGKYSVDVATLTAEELAANTKAAKNSAAKWGGWCTAGLTEASYALAEKILPYNFGHVDSEWKLLALTALATGILYHSDSFKQWNEKFPVYMNGMKVATLAYAGTTIADMILRHM